ncbi:MAG TPA: hypothetical protein VLE50_03930, partial [Cellvibrio sp.]|nr:hypothetical protein [Cellvibrio sp.]
SPAVDALTWDDASATAGLNYYYWLEFDDAISNEIIRTEPTYVATVLDPKTNLTSSRSDTGISLSWQLQNFPPIRVVEVFRNTRNQASGRTRIFTSAPHEGTLVDELDLIEGTTYWYMFKLTMEDGTTLNTAPEAMVMF